MQLFALGLNHTTAPVDIREKVSFSPEATTTALQQLIDYELVNEAVILSTCNRTEVYCVIEYDECAPVIDWLARFHGVEVEELKKHIYIYELDDAVRHLLRVACGLDSMVLGEPQILGQLKTAYSQARTAKTSLKLLTRLFEHSFSVAKQVRTDTEISSSPVSVAFAAVRLAQQIFGELNNYTALLLGAGETIELAARHLHENGLGRMVVANRTLERARNLAREFAGYAITLEEIPDHLAEADIIIASTGSKVAILEAEAVKKAIKKRKHKPMFMVDIAVPRDIDTAVGTLDDVYLYTVDDLNEVIQENIRSRAEAAKQAEEIIDTQVSHFSGWLRSLEAVDTICSIRDNAQDLCKTLVGKSKRMIDNGKSPNDVIEYLAHTLTNTLIHTPCSQLRQASYNGQEDVVVAARQLFQLPEK